MNDDGDMCPGGLRERGTEMQHKAKKEKREKERRRGRRRETKEEKEEKERRRKESLSLTRAKVRR